MSKTARRKSVKPDFTPSGSAGHSPAKWRLAEKLKVALEPDYDVPVSRLLAADLGVLRDMDRELDNSRSGVLVKGPRDYAVRTLRRHE